RAFHKTDIPPIRRASVYSGVAHFVPQGIGGGMESKHKKGLVRMHSPGTQRTVRLVTMAGYMAAVFAIAAQAQTQRSTRRIARRDTDDLSRFLIETEKRDVNESIFYDQSPNFDPSRINAAAVSSLLDRFAAGANRLYQQIDVESQYSPRLRSVLADTLKVRARATLLAQDAKTTRDLNNIAIGVRELDSDWRLLSHNIRRLPTPPRTVTELVAALDRTNVEIEKTFKIEPQIDRRELLTQVMAMSADFDNLIDDITLEMGTTVEARELVRGVRSIRTQSQYAADLIAERGTYQRIVEAYQRAETDWKPIAERLTRVRNRYIDRSVRRIVSAGNSLKELLWLENNADISELIATANAMRANVDEFFKRTPLLLIVKLQDPEFALRAANHFYDACDVYTEQVQGSADIDTLMEVFKDLEVTGQDFMQTFAPLPSRQGQLVLADISRDLRSLQEMASSHYGGDGFNMIAATDVAAELETLADHIDYDLRAWLRNRTDANTRAALALSARFKTETSELYQSIVSRRPREEIRRQTANAYEDWRKISQILRRVPEEDRDHMASISAKLTNAFLDLMLPLGL
ncbi:MAG: hypothetical protein AB8G99_15885, partial [Planctomycetaceae bacterium]